MEYRREIDGLRAIAVIPVMLFHAGVHAFSGGFVGVDVFFVISGYLITTIIVNDLEKGTFSLVNFYERRARRILPSLFFVMIICLPFAWYLLLPWELRNFGQSLVAVPVFASNVLFLLTTGGYFDSAAEIKPLLHTWSLAVEEQYYVIFPILVVQIYKYARQHVIPLLTFGLIVSIVGSEFLIERFPTFAFYMLPSRGWEILSGAVAALYLRDNHTADDSQWPSILATLGIALIAFPIFVYNGDVPFPGRYALLPVIGTVLVILFANERTRIGELLGSRLLVGVGLISYSAYLWHQPLLAFTRNYTLGEPATGVLLAMILVSLTLAYCSWRYVERPFRNLQLISSGTFVVAVVASAVGLMLLGFAIHLADGFVHRMPRNIEWESLGAKIRKEGFVCSLQTNSLYAGIESCVFGDKTAERTIAIFGDSHAQAIMPALNRDLLTIKAKGIWITAKRCTAIPGIYDTRYAGQFDIRECQRNYQELLSFVQNQAHAVIVINRWTFNLFPIEGEIETYSFHNDEGGFERNTIRNYVAIRPDGTVGLDASEKKEALKDFIRSLAYTRSKIFLVYPIPETGWDIAKLNWRHYNQSNELLESLSVSEDGYRARNRFVIEALDSIGAMDNIIRIKPEQLFCSTYFPNRCAAQVKTIPLYYDDDHLSTVGADHIVREILKNIQPY